VPVQMSYMRESRDVVELAKVAAMKSCPADEANLRFWALLEAAGLTQDHKAGSTVFFAEVDKVEIDTKPKVQPSCYTCRLQTTCASWSQIRRTALNSRFRVGSHEAFAEATAKACFQYQKDQTRV
jgi:hypothetical protein